MKCLFLLCWYTIVYGVQCNIYYPEILNRCVLVSHSILEIIDLTARMTQNIFLRTTHLILKGAVGMEGGDYKFCHQILWIFFLKVYRSFQRDILVEKLPILLVRKKITICFLSPISPLEMGE